MSTTPSERASLRVRLCTANEYGIWTGGAQAGKMDSVNATSVCGGLRFWTDALLRADGKHSCNKQERCNTSRGKPCPTCEIFGCTGRSRAFNLQVRTEKNTAIDLTKGGGRVTLHDHQHLDEKTRQMKTPTYYLTQGYVGPLELRLAMRRPHNGVYALPTEAVTALFLMLEYGTFGAYDQYGCGLVGMDEKEKNTLREACALYTPQAGPADGHGVTLRDFFFFKGKVSAPDKKKPMGEIRYTIREKVRALQSKELRHWFCGSLDRPPSGTNYAFSISPTSGDLYGWGHFARAGVPDQYSKHREATIEAVYSTIGQCCGSDFVWKEFGAKRDNASPKDWPGYFASLISTQWRKNA